MDEASRWLKQQQERPVARERMRRNRAMAKLTESQVKDKLALTEEDFEVLEDIIKNPKRNAIAQLAALKLKAQFTVAQPKVEVGGDIGVRVIVNSLKKQVEEDKLLPGAGEVDASAD